MPTFTDAMNVIERIEPIVYAAGYTLALYGSTLMKGQGNDIDLVAVPWRDADYNFLCQTLARQGYRSYPRSGGGGMYRCKVVTLKDPVTDHMIDLQVVEHAVG